MENIKEEIKTVADKLKKSEESLSVVPDSHRALLVKSLVSEGLESIQSKMKDFSKSEKETLLEVLPEVIETIQKGQKAVTLDEGENVKFHVGDVHGTGADGKNGKGSVIQEDLANDDVDETLVKPEAARHNHQGDRSPEGIEDHEVKDPDEKDKKKKKKGATMKKSEEPNQVEMEELFKSVSKLASENVSGTDIAIEVLKKGYDLDTLNVVGDMIKFAIERNNRRDSMDTECPMYKNLSKMHNEGRSRDYMKGYGMAKGGMDEGELSKMMDHLGTPKMEKSTEQALAGGNMVGLKPNPEQSQVDDKLEELQDGAVRGDQSRPKDLKVDYENVDAQKKVDNLTQGGDSVRKSVTWARDNHLLQAGEGFHSSVNDFYDLALLGQAEDLEKSETVKKDVVADILEKGEDLTECQSFVKSGLGEQMDLPFAKPSFDVSDVSAAFNISPKEQAEILGE